MFKVAFTGHRDVDSIAVEYLLEKQLSEICKWHYPVLGITGGAVGVDMLAAEVCADCGIPYVVILPFPFAVFTAKWSSSARARLRRIISGAIRTFVVQKKFSMEGYQRRNMVMVNHCDVLLAVWRGTPGGTANTVRYAWQVGKPVVNLF